MGNGDDTISCSGDDTAYLCASCGCGSYTERTVELPDGFTYQYIQCTGCSRVEYTLGQAQALIEYSREHLFLFVEDWVLAWMALPDPDGCNPAPGTAAIREQVDTVMRSFAGDHGIPSEDPGTGTGRVDRALETLCGAGHIRSGKTGARPTRKGRERGMAVLSRFDEETIEELGKLKRRLGRMTDVR